MFNSKKSRDELILKVSNISPGGAFISELIDGPKDLLGMKAFIRYVAAAELVRARLLRKKKKYLEASLIEVLEESPERIQPACPLFMQCGGCDLQHLNIHAQRLCKVKMIDDFLHFQSNLIANEGVQALAQNLPEYAYRRRLKLHVDRNGRIGHFRHNSHEIIDTHSCPIASKRINQALTALHDLRLKQDAKIASISIEESDASLCFAFSLREAALPFQKDIITKLEEMDYSLQFEYNNTIIYRSANLPPFVALAHFSQVNELANNAMVKFACSVMQGEKVCDLYAGAGNFSLPLAQQGCQVEAIEADGVLVSLGQRLAKKNSLSSTLRFTQMNCEQYAPNIPSGYSILLDPPRGGAKNVVKFLRPERSPKILYVSCSLPELARDLSILTRSGYTLRRVTFIDMFPQTHHVETLSFLEA